MSHELRTPLASIIAFAEVWLRSPESKTLEDIALMREIKRKGKELLATINNSLDAASIEAQRFAVDIVAVDLLDLVNDVESTISPLAGERELDLSVEVDPRLPLAATDPAIVHKILINLLGNAVKFTEPGGSVKLALSLDETAQNLEFRVSDTGIGIPEEDLKLIFERFRQADSSISRKYGGSGLGLSLVKEMTELLGGSVCVSSASGVGSEFTVRIPYREVEGGQY